MPAEWTAILEGFRFLGVVALGVVIVALAVAGLAGGRWQAPKSAATGAARRR